MSLEHTDSRNASSSTEFDAVAAAGTRFRSGISWFYWIAALSLVNTLSAHFANTVFVVGLGATQWLEAFLVATGAQGMALPIIATAMISGVFAALGYFGLKGKDSAIFAGLGLYAADAAIVAIYSDWLALAFHAYALYSIWQGYSTLKTAREMDLSNKVN